MKKFLLITCIVVAAQCTDDIQELTITSCPSGDIMVNAGYSKASELQTLLDKLAAQGVPGVTIALFSNEGWWASNSGFAKLSDKTPMQSCYLQYMQSVTKTYLSVAVLKLREEGKIDIDKPITHYLPVRYVKQISHAEKITVRMLLNHTSGVPEYNSDPRYISYLLQHPDFAFEPEDYLQYVDGKSLVFTPGTKYLYCNTNYLLLAFLVDEITGSHAMYIDQVIFKPLMLTQTFYRNDTQYLNYTNLVNSYWDRHSNSILENVSTLQKNNVRALVGDDGIVATPIDAVKFLMGVMQGKLISAESLAEMKTFVKDRQGQPTYGLGLDHAIFNDHVAYGHSGGGIGAGCQLYYFPDKDLYVFIAINLGTVTDSPIHERAEGTLDEIYRTLLR